MTRRTSIFVSCLATAALGSFALAADPNASADQSGAQHVDRQVVRQIREAAQDPQTACDKLFTLEAAMGNQWEIALAQQAQQKADNQQVKDMATHIVQDHQQAQQQLQPIAQQLGVQLPNGLTEDKQEKLHLLSALPADKFQKEYTSMMQADHAKDLIEYRSVAQSTQNQQLKQYTQQQLPILAQHYDMANQSAMALGLPSSGPEAVPAAGHMEGNNNSGNMNDNNTNNNGAVNGGDSTNPNGLGKSPNSRTSGAGATGNNPNGQ
jgi:putative membrane protein